MLRGPSINGRQTITSSSPGYYESFITCACLVFPCLQLRFNFNTFKSLYLPIRLFIALLFSFSNMSFISPPPFPQLSPTPACAPGLCESVLQTLQETHSTKCTNQKLLTGSDAALVYAWKHIEPTPWEKKRPKKKKINKYNWLWSLFFWFAAAS